MRASVCNCACVCACACAFVRARARARARGRMLAALPGGGPAEDESELRSHACGVAKVETRGRVPGVGRIVVVTPREVYLQPVRPRDIRWEASTGERGGAAPKGRKACTAVYAHTFGQVIRENPASAPGHRINTSAEVLVSALGVRPEVIIKPSGCGWTWSRTPVYTLVKRDRHCPLAYKTSVKARRARGTASSPRTRPGSRSPQPRSRAARVRRSGPAPPLAAQGAPGAAGRTLAPGSG